ncbi:MAG: PAS domain S-box protein [Chromatiaceae bacterium]|nr:PAS domain S-box protein [Chromatiaceae bacterium]
MNLFAKIFAVVLLLFVVSISAITFTMSDRHIERMEKVLVDRHLFLGRLITNEVQRWQSEGKWPFATLNKLTREDDIRFWWIVDSDGIIHLADDNRFVGTRAASYFDKTPAHWPPPTSKGSIRFDDSGTLGIFSQAFSVGHRQWSFWLGSSTRDIQEARRDIVAFSLIAAPIVAACLGILLFLVIHHFLGPLAKLSSGVRRIGEGDLSFRLNGMPNDEVGSLAESVNAMAAQLTQREESLRERMLALRDQQQQVKLLLESTAEAIFGLDTHGNCTFANPACVRMLGYRDADELAGRNMHGLIHHSRLCGAPYPAGDCAIYRSFLSGEGIHLDTEVLWRADGSSFPAEFWSYPILRDGEAIGSVVTFLDITERKRVEMDLSRAKELLDSIINGIADPIFVKDAGHRFIAVNDALCDLVGHARTDLLGKSDYYFFPAEEADVFWAHDDRVLGTNEVDVNEEKLTGAKGTRIVSTVKSPFTNPMTGNRNLVGTIRDITEQKHVEQTLRRAQKMDAIGQLSGGIAHDFNNILGVIVGSADLLKLQVPADHQALDRVETIQKAAQRAADLTRQLVGFARQQPAQAVATDINRVIVEMQSLIARSVTPEVEVTHDFSDNLWRTEIDPGDFQDALLNLVINAHDAMPGGGRLTLETRNCTLDSEYCMLNPGAEPGDYVQLAVSDSGHGIPPEDQEHIFEPFFSTKAKDKGTGLGLAMVYGFTTRSGGHIKVYSEPGIGTTFRLYLPRVVGQEQSEERIADQPGTLPRGRETILAVDDEAALLELAQTWLEALGYRVVTAKDGPQALELLAEEPAIDLLFSDVVMPGGINGYELAERATTARPALKVLLTSGYTENALSNNGQARFAANLLNKPYTPTELARRVRSLLGNAESATVDPRVAH